MSKGNLNLFKNSILLTRPLQDSIAMSRNISSEFKFFIAPLLEIEKVDYDLNFSENFDIILFLARFESFSPSSDNIKSLTSAKSVSVSNKAPVFPIISGIPKTLEPIGMHPHNIASQTEFGSPSNRDP